MKNRALAVQVAGIGKAASADSDGVSCSTENQFLTSTSTKIRLFFLCGSCIDIETTPGLLSTYQQNAAKSDSVPLSSYIFI
jgi:hypothetical protein